MANPDKIGQGDPLITLKELYPLLEYLTQGSRILTNDQKYQFITIMAVSSFLCIAGALSCCCCSKNSSSKVTSLITAAAGVITLIASYTLLGTFTPTSIPQA